MKVIIISEGNSPNLGDQAIRFSMEQLFQQCGAHTVSYPYTDKFDSKPAFDLNETPGNKKLALSLLKAIIPARVKDHIFKIRWRKKKRAQIAALDVLPADIAVIGGGQLLNLNRNFPIAFDLWTQFLSKAELPIYCIAIGYGTIWENANALLLKESLSRITKIYFRDCHSRKKISTQFGVNSEFIYDVAFCISDFIPRKESLSKEKKATVLPASYRHVVLHYNKQKSLMDYLKEMADSCESLVEEGYKINLSITDLHQDKDIVVSLSNYLSARDITHTIQIPNDLDELCHIISSSDLIFSGRMHALIIGYSYGKRCMVYSLSEKLKFFEQDIVKKRIPLTDIKHNIYSTIQLIMKRNSS